MAAGTGSGRSKGAAAAAALQGDGRYGVAIGVTMSDFIEGTDCLSSFFVDPLGQASYGQFGTAFVLTPEPASSSPLFTFASLADAEAFVARDEFEIIRQVLLSLHRIDA